MQIIPATMTLSEACVFIRALFSNRELFQIIDGYFYIYDAAHTN